MLPPVVGRRMPDEPLRVSFVMGSATAPFAGSSGIARLRQTAALHLIHETAVVVLPGTQPRERLTNSAWFALVV